MNSLNNGRTNQNVQSGNLRKKGKFCNRGNFNWKKRNRKSKESLTFAQGIVFDIQREKGPRRRPQEGVPRPIDRKISINRGNP
jgi:hypothetical protein